MTYCQYIQDPEILDLVHNCDETFFDNLKINKIIQTGAYGLVIIVTTKDEYQKSFALKIQLVRYDPAIKNKKGSPRYRSITTLNKMVYSELLTLCRVKDLIHNGIADQFPEIDRYFVCPLDSVPEPFNKKIMRDIEDYSKGPIDELLEVSIISMAYIHGDTLSDTKIIPRTTVFDFYYGIFALFLYARVNVMPDLHDNNIIVTKTDIDTYFEVTYDDIFHEKERSVVIKIPKGYPRIKFIDFGQAIDISYQTIDRKSTLLSPHDVMVSLDPNYIYKHYRTANKSSFPLIEEYHNKIRNNPNILVYDLFNYIMSLVIDYMSEFILSEIPANITIYSLEFPE